MPRSWGVAAISASLVQSPRESPHCASCCCRNSKESVDDEFNADQSVASRVCNRFGDRQKRKHGHREKSTKPDVSRRCDAAHKTHTGEQKERDRPHSVDHVVRRSGEAPRKPDGTKPADCTEYCDGDRRAL